MRRREEHVRDRRQGLFAGVSLEGTVVAARHEENHKYYGRAVTPKEILSGAAKLEKAFGGF